MYSIIEGYLKWSVMSNAVKMEEENATQVLDNNDALNENYEALR